MRKPVVAIIAFPGNNSEAESMRYIRQNGMDALYFRWNDDRSKLKDVDGYFLVGGFAYEDRGRSGMVAARDSLMDFIGQEAEAGKAVIGNCNGAQVLVESGLIPMDRGLRMSLARNAVGSGDHVRSPGFINEWVWIKPACAADRCATSNWTGTMHLPIAHGEGRYVTRDGDLYKELKENNQIAFTYCDESGNVSEDVAVTPSGSPHAIAGICNPSGNVVALMPHPERSPHGNPYFASFREWMLRKHEKPSIKSISSDGAWTIGTHETAMTEIFIDTIITNNEERTVEKAAKRHAPGLHLKQWKYLAIPESRVQGVLADLTVFNPNKERAFIRRGSSVTRWQGKEERSAEAHDVFKGILLLRRDEPDTGPSAYGKGAETGICYGCDGIADAEAGKRAFLEILANPHASTLQRILP